MVEPLRIERRECFALATIMARRGVSNDDVARALDVPCPDANRWAGTPALRLIATGPGTWLAYAESAPGDWERTLRAKLTGLASVSDQSGGYVIWRVSGPDARVLLQRGLAIDLDAQAFLPGAVAVSVIAHIGVIMWQIDDAPTYDVAVFRSFAGSFRAWVDETAATV